MVSACHPEAAVFAAEGSQFVLIRSQVNFVILRTALEDHGVKPLFWILGNSPQHSIALPSNHKEFQQATSFPPLASLLSQLRGPVQHDREGLGGRFHRVDKEVLAVRSDIPTQNTQERFPPPAHDKCLEQRFRNTRSERRSLSHAHSHQLSVERNIKQFLAITSPARLVAAVAGDLRLATTTPSRGETLNVDFGPSRLV